MRMRNKERAEEESLQRDANNKKKSRLPAIGSLLFCAVRPRYLD